MEASHDGIVVLLPIEGADEQSVDFDSLLAVPDRPIVIECVAGRANTVLSTKQRDVRAVSLTAPTSSATVSHLVSALRDAGVCSPLFVVADDLWFGLARAVNRGAIVRLQPSETIALTSGRRQLRRMYPVLADLASAVDLCRGPMTDTSGPDGRRAREVETVSEALVADLVRWQLRAEVTKAAVETVSDDLLRTIALRAAIRASVDAHYDDDFRHQLEAHVGTPVGQVIARTAFIEQLTRQGFFIDSVQLSCDPSTIGYLDRLDPIQRGHFALRIDKSCRVAAKAAHLDVEALQPTLASFLAEESGHTVGSLDVDAPSPKGTSVLLDSAEVAASVSYATITTIGDGPLSSLDVDAQLNWIATSASRFSKGRGTRHDGVELLARWTLASRSFRRGEDVCTEIEQLEERCGPPLPPALQAEVIKQTASLDNRAPTGLWALPDSPSRTLAILENRGFGGRSSGTLATRLEQARLQATVRLPRLTACLTTAETIAALYASAPDKRERDALADRLVDVARQVPDVLESSHVRGLISRPTWPSLLLKVRNLKKEVTA